MNYQDIFDNTGPSRFIAHTEESKKHLSDINLGKRIPQEVIDRLVATRKANGYSHSEETRAKMSAAKKANPRKGFSPSEEHRAQISAAMKGRVVSAETRSKMRIANGKPLMTPDGVFVSKTAYAEAKGFYINKVSHLMQKYPEQYYLVD